MAKKKPFETKPGEAKELAKYGAKVVEEAKAALGKTELQAGDVEFYRSTKKVVNLDDWKQEAKDLGWTAKEIKEEEERREFVDESSSRESLLDAANITDAARCITPPPKPPKVLTKAEKEAKIEERLQAGISSAGGTGIGVVADSDPAAYYEKIRRKGRAGVGIAVLNNEPLMLWDAFHDVSDMGSPEVRSHQIRKNKPLKNKPTGYTGPVYKASTDEFVYTRKGSGSREPNLGAILSKKKQDDWESAGKPHLYWSDADGIDRKLTKPIPQKIPTFGALAPYSAWDKEANKKVMKPGKDLTIYDHGIVEWYIRKGMVPESARVKESWMNISDESVRNVFNIRDEKFKVELGGQKYSKESYYENKINKLSKDEIKQKGGFKVPTEYGNWGNFWCMPTCNLDNAFEIDNATMFDTAKIVKRCAKCNRPDWWMDIRSGVEFEEMKSTCADCSNKKIIKPRMTTDRKIKSGKWRSKSPTEWSKRAAPLAKKDSNGAIQQGMIIEGTPGSTKVIGGGIWYEWDKTTIAGLLSTGAKGEPGKPRPNVSADAVDDFLKQVFG